MWVIVCVAVLLSVFYMWRESESPLKYPPGPRPWPVVGNLVQVALRLLRLKCHHLVWAEWARRYGDLVGLRLGATNLVIVSGKELIHEVASRTEFNGRPDGFFYTLRSYGKKVGIVFSDGEEWARKRSVVMAQLRVYGFGSRAMEHSIRSEADALVQLLGGSTRPLLVNELFDGAVTNVLWNLVAGNRFDLTDERLRRLCAQIKRSFKVVDMSGGLLNCLPWLRHVAPDLVGYTELKQLYEAMHRFIGATIKEHKARVNEHNPRDVIEAFLVDTMKHKREQLSEDELRVVCLDLLQAGAETVSNTLVYLVLYMVLHPGVQERVHGEVARACAGTGDLTIDDRIRLPFTEAVVLEVLRLSSVAPVGIAHVAMHTTQLGDYTIPRGTIMLLSIYSMHMNEYWKDPEVFRPERFLNETNAVIQHDWLMPFGSGRRRCLGESLARAELFIIFATLMRKFRVTTPDGDRPPDTAPVDGVSLSAKPFRAVFTLRT